MNRRQALAALALLPASAARLAAQARATGGHRVVLGQNHGLLLAPDGTLQSWLRGPRSDGLATNALGLGHNNPIEPHVLNPVVGLTEVVWAAASNDSSLAVRRSGEIVAWGDNGLGQMGTTPPSDFAAKAWWNPPASRPQPVATKFDAVNVHSQSEHVVALARDGSVYTWGKATLGQLGIGTLPTFDFKQNNNLAYTFIPYPIRVPDLSNVVDVSAGRMHSLALIKDGTVRAWGENIMGQLGDGTTVNRDRPVQVAGVRNAVAIAAGVDFSVAVLADGTAMTWGNRNTNALGRDSTSDAAASPTPAPALGARGLKSVAAGLRHVVALTEAGTVMTWGDDTFGQLGRGPSLDLVQYAPSAPTVIKGISGATSVAAINSTSVAVLSSGRILTWGGVRLWTRPGSGDPGVARQPILLWLDGLEQPPW